MSFVCKVADNDDMVVLFDLGGTMVDIQNDIYTKWASRIANHPSFYAGLSIEEIIKQLKEFEIRELKTQNKNVAKVRNISAELDFWKRYYKNIIENFIQIDEADEIINIISVDRMTPSCFHLNQFKDILNVYGMRCVGRR